jgi:hypothetical protein
MAVYAAVVNARTAARVGLRELVMTAAFAIMAAAMTGVSVVIAVLAARTAHAQATAARAIIARMAVRQPS